LGFDGRLKLAGSLSGVTAVAVARGIWERPLRRGRSGNLGTNGVLTSTDGTGWTAHARFTESAISDLIFANGRFYAVEQGYYAEARIFSSPDGVQRRAHPTGFHQTLVSLAAAPQGLFAFGLGGVILHSPWDLI
jgi:hypothetical protein